jgi:hypothetical protein
MAGMMNVARIHHRYVRWLALISVLIIAVCLLPPDSAAAYYRGTRTFVVHDWDAQGHVIQQVIVTITVNHHDVTANCQALIKFDSRRGSVSKPGLFNITIGRIRLQRDGGDVQAKGGQHIQHVSYTQFSTDAWYNGGTANYQAKANFFIRFPSGHLRAFGENITYSKVDNNKCQRF